MRREHARPTESNAASLGALAAIAGARNDQRTLELGKPTKHREHQPSVMARSFCGDLRHRQAAHLQGATKRQADHGEGADQHADRNQLAIAVAHTWQRITKGPPLERRAPPHRRCALFIPHQAGTSEPRGGRELRALGLNRSRLPLPRKERPRCGARNRQGKPCSVRVEPGKRRCRFHGGLSTGPKTAAGRARIAEAQRRRWNKFREIG